MPTLQSTPYHALLKPDGLSPEDTLFCGQCFRFTQESEDTFTGFAGSRRLTLKEDGDSLLFFCPDEDIPFWKNYFDFDTDYTFLKDFFAKDPILAKACSFAPGIRVLRQEPWEALCSFIISQNNNIIRISGIIDRLCSCFGEPLPLGGFGFPTPSRLAPLAVEDLSPLRAGFRAKYILDAARKVTDGTVDLDAIRRLPIQEAREQLMQIKGVGVKVAECALLYGFHRTEAFPVDTWIKKALARYYPQGFPEEFVREQGIAQQFLFHYIRHLERTQS